MIYECPCGFSTHSRKEWIKHRQDEHDVYYTFDDSDLRGKDENPTEEG